MSAEASMEVNEPMSDDEGSCAPQRAKAAAQACETCRVRKVKCDEERPRCGVCRRLKTKCEYREPKPTKRDKTLIYMLEALKTIESKVDMLVSSYEAQQAASSEYQLPQHISPSSRPAFGADDVQAKPDESPYQSISPSFDKSYGFSSTVMSPSGPLVAPGSLSRAPRPQASTTREEIEARKLLQWPVVRQMLIEDNIPMDIINAQNIPVEKWIIDISANMDDYVQDIPPISFQQDQMWNSATIILTPARVIELAVHYFESFHRMYPIIDQCYFREVVLPKAHASNFDPSDQHTTLLLLVLALGTVAHDGIHAQPILDPNTNRQTGVRGGDIHLPPGYPFVHEAKKRLGLALTNHDIITLQSFLLLALYYAQISRNVDYWRTTMLAATLSKALVRTVVDWDSFESNTISLTFWMCILMEGGLTTELGVLPTGITDLASSVYLPRWLPYQSGVEPGPLDLLSHYHFLAQITLRSHITRIQDSIKPFRACVQTGEQDPYSHTSGDPSIDSAGEVLTQPHVTQALLDALQRWRQLLPEPLQRLQWDENLPLHPGSHRDSLRVHWSEPYEGVRRVTGAFANIDTILDAALRTRYKYAQYLIWRPFLYKILHYPLMCNEVDLEGAMKALKAISLWPLTHPIFDDQRRLLPHLYEYSHTIFGILLLLKAAERNGLLVDSMTTATDGVPPASEYEAIKLNPGNHWQCLSDDLEVSKRCFLAWMKDMQVVHPVAEWCMRTLRQVYKAD